jgi:hypothetical protein
VNRTNQSTVIKKAINSYLDRGVTDKQDIYTKVVDELGVPRPTVRRVTRDLRNELLEKIEALRAKSSKSDGTKTLQNKLQEKAEVLRPVTASKSVDSKSKSE